MKLSSLVLGFGLAMLATAALAIENGDPFSTGDSYGPRGGDYTLRGNRYLAEQAPLPTRRKVKTNCNAQFLTAAEWMKCSPEFQVPAPGYRHP